MNKTAAETPLSGRRIFIGDIQGCREELEQLLETVRFDSSRDRLDPVGDLVNRGPDSLGTLRLLKSLNAGGVLGNHDLHLLAVLRGEREPRSGDTLEAILDAPDVAELAAWLRARPFIKAWPDVLLVHAGLSPVWTDPIVELTGRRPEDKHSNLAIATRIRWCDDQGQLPDPDTDPPRAKGFRPWYEHVAGRFKATLVFGHWARAGLVKRPGLRGLDTGCVWGGKLTAWIAEDDTFTSVPARRQYSAFDR